MAEQGQGASGWISTAERLPERGQYIDFVAEGEEEVLIGQFWDAFEGGWYFRDIIDGQHHREVLSWRPIDLPSEEVQKLVSTHEKLRQKLRALMSPDTIETAQLTKELSTRMQDIRRKLGGTAADS